MRIARKSANGESRELLLKEYFLNAYLIALLKAAGEQVGEFTRRPQKLKVAPVRIR